jgi:uncharacterized protein
VPALIGESFSGPALDPRLRWLNEPQRWSLDQCLRVHPAAQSDFWQRTHYGFRADNGHFLYAECPGDFRLTAHVRFMPAHQYDQAGLMVRVSEDEWLKTSVEYEPEGPARLGAVVTHAGYSDWSTQDFPRDCHEIELRIDREHDTFIVHWRLPGGVWSQLRVARLDAPEAVHAGLYACSPKGAGLTAEFFNLRIE